MEHGFKYIHCDGNRMETWIIKAPTQIVDTLFWHYSCLIIIDVQLMKFQRDYTELSRVVMDRRLSGSKHPAIFQIRYASATEPRTKITIDLISFKCIYFATFVNRWLILSNSELPPSADSISFIVRRDFTVFFSIEGSEFYFPLWISTILFSKSLHLMMIDFCPSIWAP